MKGGNIDSKAQKQMYLAGKAMDKIQGELAAEGALNGDDTQDPLENVAHRLLRKLSPSRVSLHVSHARTRDHTRCVYPYASIRFNHIPLAASCCGHAVQGFAVARRRAQEPFPAGFLPLTTAQGD